MPRIQMFQILHSMVRTESFLSSLDILFTFILNFLLIHAYPGCSLLQQSNQPICRPCVTLHTHHSSKNEIDASDSKSSAQNRKVTVRSRYFKQKSVNADNQENELADISIQNGVAADTCLKMHHHLSKGNMKRKEPHDEEILTVGS